MNEALSIAIAIASAYLLGSIPSAYIVGRLKKGVDIRQIGSQNMGAMNTFYKVGITSGLLVLAVDIGKGAAAVALARWLGVPPIIEMLAGTNAVIGHGFPVWLNFRGGKGGATLIGVLFFFMPWAIPIGLTVFGLLLLLTRFPTLSYSIALICFPFIAWLIYHHGDYVVFSLLLCLIPLIKYIPRIKEMRAKTTSWRRLVLRKNLKDRF